jgi:hypothetical protein
LSVLTFVVMIFIETALLSKANPWIIARRLLGWLAFPSLMLTI